MEKKNLEIQLVTDMAEAERLWRQFSPNETIFESWELRALFQKYHQKDIRFYAGYVEGELIGVFPLQFNKDKNLLEFFGGDYMEDNRLFLQPEFETYRVDFFDYIQTLDEKIKLEYMSGEDAFTTSLPVQDHKYILPIEKYTTLEEYVTDVFSSETKKTMLKKMRRIDRLGVEITKNNFADIEKLFELNIAMFGEHSSFSDRPFHKEIFRELFTFSPEMTPYFLTFTVGGEVIGVSISLEYHESYAYILLGINPSGVKDMATYINLKNIETAIQAKAKFVDCFVGAYGWKDRWHFTAIPKYTFVKE